MSVKRKVGLIHLTPVVLTLIFSTVFALLYSGSTLLSEEIAPFLREDTLEASIYNAFIFFLLTALGTIILLLLSLKRKLSLLRMFFIVTVTVVLFSFYQILLLVVFEKAYGPETLPDDFIFLFIPLLLTLFSSYIIFYSQNEILVMVLTILYGSGLGTLLGAMLPLWSIIAIGLVMSIYDLYSVFRGPLKKIIDVVAGTPREGEEGERKDKMMVLRGVAVPFRGLNIGLGDLVFYSMFNTVTFMSEKYTPLATLMVQAAIILGSFLTLRGLEKYKAMPALPLPILFSTMVIILWMLIP